MRRVATPQRGSPDRGGVVSSQPARGQPGPRTHATLFAHNVASVREQCGPSADQPASHEIVTDPVPSNILDGFRILNSWDRRPTGIGTQADMPERIQDRPAPGSATRSRTARDSAALRRAACRDARERRDQTRSRRVDRQCHIARISCRHSVEAGGGGSSKPAFPATFSHCRSRQNARGSQQPKARVG